MHISFSCFFHIMSVGAAKVMFLCTHSTSKIKKIIFLVPNQCLACDGIMILTVITRSVGGRTQKTHDPDHALQHFNMPTGDRFFLHIHLLLHLGFAREEYSITHRESNTTQK